MSVVSAPPNERTRKVEKLVAELLSMPLMRENVFHSAKYRAGSQEKEVCDVLLSHRGEAIVVSIKAQEKERGQSETHRWLRSAGAKGISQISGAYRTLQTREFWCDHDVRGRSTFRAGELRPRHGVAVLESQFDCVVDGVGSELDRLRKVAPVTLIGLTDFLHLTANLRTWRDLTRYLDSRSTVLSDPDRRAIGAEYDLFNFYTRMGDSLAGCVGIADAKIARAAGMPTRDNAASRVREAKFAAALEDFIRVLSTADGFDLPDDVEALKESVQRGLPSARDVLLDDLCDLTVQERAALGEKIGELGERIDKEAPGEEAVLYAAMYFGRFPNKLYLVVAARGMASGEASLTALDLLIAGCVHRGKNSGVLLLDAKEGSERRVTIGRMDDIEPSLEMIAAGQEYFGHVRPNRIEQTRRHDG